MLNNLSKQIRNCYTHAVQCEEKAKNAVTEAMRADFLRLRDNWMNLPRSYEFAEQILAFNKENYRKRALWQSPRTSRGETIQ